MDIEKEIDEFIDDYKLEICEQTEQTEPLSTKLLIHTSIDHLVHHLAELSDVEFMDEHQVHLIQKHSNSDVFELYTDDINITVRISKEKGKLEIDFGNNQYDLSMFSCAPEIIDQLLAGNFNSIERITSIYINSCISSGKDIK